VTSAARVNGPGGLLRREVPQRAGPWDRPGTLYFCGGDLSSFALTPGLRLPGGWHGHPRPAQLVDVPSAEHYFQACKADNLDDFLWILSAPTPRIAKRRGGRHGEGGRRITLRPDWEPVKFSVMRVAHAGKHRLPRFRPVLPATGERVLVEWSPTDPLWGGRDRQGGATGTNLLGVVLMEVRAELLAGASARAS
jgi:ribA/ribD-fused uncharacterized protein